ncbi:glycosyltransferase [Thermodesulfovibrionales bacterium]|nr:glycosyltransferase [Thermodesulfovibrionales bacterium]
MNNMAKNNPQISIIVPCYNEERHIKDCLDSLIDDYVADNAEILIADGMSTDGTRKIIEDYIKKHSDVIIKLIDNKKKHQSYGLNIGIDRAQGDIIVRIDAHARYPRGYVKACVELLERVEADNVGGITEIYGIYEMIEAIEQTDVKLLLAGRFMLVTERNRAVTMPGWSGVEELGQLNRDKVKEVLSRSMAGLILLRPDPNHTDVRSNKMFEYMSAGIPVISSDFPLWKEIIEGNQCGICVNPLNPGAIAQAIRWIVDNPDEAKQMGENGRRAVEEKYNWESESQKLLAMYGDLLKNDDK